MAEFEREIYQNPNQDLDLLWYNLNLKFLGQKYPLEIGTSYWASLKLSVNLSCSMHNFVLADVFAAQLQHAVETKVLSKTSGVYTNNKAVGKYLVENLYRYGNLLPWDQLIEKSTGEPLNSCYFVNSMIEDEDAVNIPNEKQKQ
jgi:peptidyl-dipeptidase A